MTSAGPVFEQPLEHAKLETLVEQGRVENKAMMSVGLGLYVILIIVIGVISFIAFRRITALQESTVTKISRNVGEIAEAARKSEIVPKLFKAATDVFTASATRAANDIAAAEGQKSKSRFSSR